MRARSTISSISKTPYSTVLWANGKKMGCALFLRETVEWQLNADMRYFQMEFSLIIVCAALKRLFSVLISTEIV